MIPASAKVIAEHPAPLDEGIVDLQGRDLANEATKSRRGSPVRSSRRYRRGPVPFRGEREFTAVDLAQVEITPADFVARGWPACRVSKASIPRRERGCASPCPVSVLLGLHAHDEARSAVAGCGPPSRPITAFQRIHSALHNTLRMSSNSAGSRDGSREAVSQNKMEAVCRCERARPRVLLGMPRRPSAKLSPTCDRIWRRSVRGRVPRAAAGDRSISSRWSPQRRAVAASAQHLPWNCSCSSSRKPDGRRWRASLRNFLECDWK